MQLILLVVVPVRVCDPGKAENLTAQYRGLVVSPCGAVNLDKIELNGLVEDG
ncbi:MAG: hypothetical protein ACI376_06380 [Candidatus Bruticola sp.]